MSGIICVLLAFYMYQLGWGYLGRKIVSGQQLTWMDYLIGLFVIAMGVMFYFMLKKALRENKARKEEQAEIRARYEKKRAAKIREMYVEDYEEPAPATKEPDPEPDTEPDPKPESEDEPTRSIYDE